jgi:hypothetical protein
MYPEVEKTSPSAVADRLIQTVLSRAIVAGRMSHPEVALDVCARGVFLTCMDAVREASGNRGCVDFVAALRRLAERDFSSDTPEVPR